MRRRKVSGALMTTVQTGRSPPTRTSWPSQRRKAKGGGRPPNTSRRMPAARAGLGWGARRPSIEASPCCLSNGADRPCQPSRGLPPEGGLPPDGLHDLGVLEGALGGALEDDLAAVDGVQPVGHAGGGHEVDRKSVV